MAPSTARTPSLSRGSLRRQSSTIRTGCANERPSGSARGVPREWYPYRDPTENGRIGVQFPIFVRILGNTAFKYQRITHGLLGPAQLLPSNSHPTSPYNSTHWLTCDSDLQQSFPWPPSNIYDTYRDASGRVGLFCSADDGYIAGEIGKCIDSAESFHADLVTCFHDPTHVIAVNGHETDVGVDLSNVIWRNITSRSTTGATRGLRQPMPTIIAAVPGRGSLTKCSGWSKNGVVSEDWVVRYKNRLLQLERQSQPSRSRVLVRENEAGEIAIYYRGQHLASREVPLPSIAMSRGRGAAPSPAPPSPSPPRTRPPRPAAHHPWRRGWQEMKTPAFSWAW